MPYRSVSNKNPYLKKSLGLSRSLRSRGGQWLPRINRQTVDSWVIQFTLIRVGRRVRVCAFPAHIVRRRILARSTGEISLSLVENKYLFLLQT